MSTFVSQQAQRERTTATTFLSAQRVAPQRFKLAVAAFGSGAGVLLDSGGRLLDVVPSAPALLGKPIAGRYAHLSAAERGKVAVSNVVPSASKREPVAAIAVPFSTSHGRRVFSVAYQVSGSALGAFVDHVIAIRPHSVYLLDNEDHVLASSPHTRAASLTEADPTLARALARGANGTVKTSNRSSTFTSASVPGTHWRLVIAVSDARLFASIEGWTRIVPWVVFALVAALAVLLVSLFARSLADRTRLVALSVQLERSARTDPLTGLFNRRALNEHLKLATAHARRRGEPVSVLMIDLDNFKQINDRHGHAAGDSVLCAVADCMRTVLRADDIYGRMGGDEFLVLMPTSDETDARTVAERLQTTARMIDLRDRGLSVGIGMSIGSATATQTTPDALVAAADYALYGAKQHRGTYGPSPSVAAQGGHA